MRKMMMMMMMMMLGAAYTDHSPRFPGNSKVIFQTSQTLHPGRI